jgi:DNA-binding MarR family transcriptional regulator
MAVNRASQSRPDQSGPDESVEEELSELVRRLRPVFAALKRSGPAPASFEEAFQRTSLGPRHAPAVMAVAFEGELSVSDLAEMLGLSLSTTSLLVGELSRAGIVDRAEDERDRRRTIVRLNEHYRADAEAWLQERLVPFRRALRRLTAPERAGFLEGWRVLAEEMSRDTGGEPGCAARD